MEYFQDVSRFLALQEKFVFAVQNAKIDTIREFFDNKKEGDIVPDINGAIQDTPAILAAAMLNHWDVVKELYFYEADINVASVAHGWYLINEVTVKGPEGVFNVLKDECDLFVKNRHGESPLMIALRYQKYERAAIIDATGRNDYSALNKDKENAGHYAIREKQYDLFISMIKNGLAYNQKSKTGKVPMDLLEDDIVRIDLEAKIKALDDSRKLRVAAGSEYKYVKAEKAAQEVEEVPQEVVKKSVGLSKIMKR